MPSGALRGDRGLILIALVGACLFFPSLPRLWPARPSAAPHPPLAARGDVARAFFADHGAPGAGALTETRTVAYPVLFDRRGIEARWGLRRTAALLDAPRWRIVAPAPQGAERSSPAEVTLTDDGGLWAFVLPRPRRPQRPVDSVRAAEIAWTRVPEGVWRLTRLARQTVRRAPTAARARPDRLEWIAVFERPFPGGRGALERASVSIEGERVVRLDRYALRDFADRSPDPTIPARRLDQAGQALFGAFVLIGLGIFFLRLRDGTARLRAPALCAAVVFAATLTASLLVSAGTDPVDRAFSVTRDSLWTLVALIAALSAGDALDRRRGGVRGAALWTLLRGKVFDPEVARACLRGLGVALVCGGVLAVSVRLLVAGADGAVAPQPRGTFFSGMLNARLWPVAVGLYFLHVALLEELGYRFFAGTWLLAATRRAWVAVAVPALVYGLTHTPVDFLPPEEPFWGRPVAMTLVGAVWGVAFLRYGALCVVVSHWLADLFLILWPKLSGGNPGEVAAALCVLALPLTPALGLLRRGGGKGVQSGERENP